MKFLDINFQKNYYSFAEIFFVMSISKLVSEIIKFRDERNWAQFHTPKNLALSIIIELGELFELIQWKTDDEIKKSIKKDKNEIEEEIADIAIYLFLLSSELGINLETAIPKKIRKNEIKYPIL